MCSYTDNAAALPTVPWFLSPPLAPVINGKHNGARTPQQLMCYHWPRAVRCVDCEGNGAADNVVAALDWLAGNYELPAVASLSLGSNSINAALDTAMQNVIALGITGVVAAGNYNSGARSGF